jgi:hypothetical protein
MKGYEKVFSIDAEAEGKTKGLALLWTKKKKVG